MPRRQFATYAEFWPYYLGEHSKNSTRMFHIFGTAMAIFAFLKAIGEHSFGWLLMVFVFGYGFAWIAHVFIQKNRPATFTHPLWSLLADFHMFALWVTGRLGSELTKYNIGK
jgi:hypothetical protein